MTAARASGAAGELRVWLRGGFRVRVGSEREFGPGDVSVLPPGHDAWVVGNDPVVVIDVTGMAEYARPK